VNQGGEPAHDDYGLPRVDVQVPDDARELDRDVQAYHRELRALRRHELSLRWRAPLRHSGMIVPLIAGCLVLAMVAGMVLTMFSANSYLGGGGGISDQQDRNPAKSDLGARNGSSGSSASPSAARNASGGPATPAAKRLPQGKIKVDGQTLDLATMVTAALALIPANCRCAVLIRRLGNQAAAAGVGVYLVGRRGSATEARRLAAETKGAHFALDSDNVLNGYASSHLTVVLVDSQHNVTRPALPKDFDLAAALESLQQGP
jgi:hypothetical protein